MNLFTFLKYGVLLFSTLAAATVSPDRLTSSSVSTVFQLNKNCTWFENLVVRPNGDILTTRIDVPELWSINTGNRKTGNQTRAPGSILHKFPNATSLTGIAEIGNDAYAVVSGNISMSTSSSVPGSFKVWTISFSGDKFRIATLAPIPDAELLNGITKFGNDLLLMADTVKGVIWRLNITSGEYSQALSDPTLLPAQDQPLRVGVNGVKTTNNHVYFTSTTQGIFGRFPVDRHASATGQVEIISSGFTPDDFILTKNGTAYVTTNPQNQLLKITPEGTVQHVAGNAFNIALGGCNAVAFSQSQSVLYVTTIGAQLAPIMCKQIEPTKILAISI